MSHEAAAPVRCKFLSTGTWVLLALSAMGLAAGLYRFAFGLRASTNLDHYYPWGIWIIADVSLIALGAGGFVTAAIAHILNRRNYHFLARPALLTALLGYTFACILLAADLGKYYNIWHPLLPSMWQGNSALFEVGLCVMSYLIVLYVEFVPIFCARYKENTRRPLLAAICRRLDMTISKVMSVFIVLGVGISCLHQSSLGHIFVLAPSKLHPLWWSPILSLLFLLSAVMAGVPTVIFVTICAGRAFGRVLPMRQLSRLARYVPLLLAVYLAIKLGDLLIRQQASRVIEGSLQSIAFLIELVPFLVVPLVMLLSSRVRASSRWLAAACLLVMIGIVVNRANVYWIGYQPIDAHHVYVPSLTEWAFTVGVVATLILAWRMVALNFPIITPTRYMRIA